MSNTRTALENPNINLVALADGSAVSQRVADIIDIIEERWGGRVQVNWIPTRALKDDQYQFQMVEVLSDGSEHPFMWIKDESEFTAHVLERLIAADNSEANVLDRLDAHNAAVEAVAKKLVQDKMGEKADIFKHVIQSPLNTYKVNKDIIIKDYGDRSR